MEVNPYDVPLPVEEPWVVQMEGWESLNNLSWWRESDGLLANVVGCPSHILVGIPGNKRRDRLFGLDVNPEVMLAWLDEVYHRTGMSEALSSAYQVKNTTKLEPAVGCVLTAGNPLMTGCGPLMCVGRTEPDVFAEVATIEKAKRPQWWRDDDTWLWTTLEPYHPEQIDAILAEPWIRHVVIGCLHPLADGKGYQQLKDAGLDVVVGVRGAACKKLIADFAAHVQKEKEDEQKRKAAINRGRAEMERGQKYTELPGPEKSTGRRNNEDESSIPSLAGPWED